MKLGEVDVQRAIESQRRRNGRHDLADQPVQVGVSGPLDVQVPAAYVVDGLVVHHERTVRVLERGVRGQYGVVGLDHGRRHLWCRVDGELQLALLAVVHAQPLHEQRREPGTGAAAERVEHQKALQPGTLIGQLPDPVQHDVHDLLADRVVAPRVVVGRVLLAGDQLLGMEQLTVRAGTHFVCDNHIAK